MHLCQDEREFSQMIPQIANDIRTRRKHLKITQRDLAELSRTSLRTIKTIEAGNANPTIDVLARILEPIGLRLVVSERIRDE